MLSLPLAPMSLSTILAAPAPGPFESIMILRLFLYLGALWGMSGIGLQMYYRDRMPLPGSLLFVFIGGSIIAVVNRWWLLADWNDEWLMIITAGGLTAAWLFALSLVRTYLIQQDLLEELRSNE